MGRKEEAQRKLRFLSFPIVSKLNEQLLMFRNKCSRFFWGLPQNREPQYLPSLTFHVHWNRLNFYYFHLKTGFARTDGDRRLSGKLSSENGEYRTRTGGLCGAIAALYQLS